MAGREFGKRVALAVATATALLLPASLAAAAPVERPWMWASPWTAPAGTASRCVALAPGVAQAAYAVCESVGGGEAVVVACLTGDGAEAWTAASAGPRAAGVRPAAAARHSSGDAVVAGLWRGSGGADGYVARFAAADGTLRWQRVWDGPASEGWDAFEAVACDRAGNVYVAGNAAGGTTQSDLVLIKYSAAGRRLWTRYYATARDDWAEDLAVDARGNVYVLGTVRAEKGGESRILLASWRPDGTRRWARQMAGVGLSYTGAGLTLRGSALYVAGQVWVDNALPLAAKFTTAGQRLWARAVWPVVSWVAGRPQVDGSGRVGVASNAIAHPASGTVAAVGLSVLAADGTYVVAREEVWSPLGEPEAWPAGAWAAAVDGLGRWYVGGWVARAVDGAADAAVVRWPSADAETWRAQDLFRLRATPGDGCIYALLRAGDRVFAGGEAGGQAVVDCIDAGTPRRVPALSRRSRLRAACRRGRGRAAGRSRGRSPRRRSGAGRRRAATRPRARPSRPCRRPRRGWPAPRRPQRGRGAAAATRAAPIRRAPPAPRPLRAWRPS